MVYLIANTYLRWSSSYTKLLSCVSQVYWRDKVMSYHNITGKGCVKTDKHFACEMWNAVFLICTLLFSETHWKLKLLSKWLILVVTVMLFYRLNVIWVHPGNGYTCRK